MEKCAEIKEISFGIVTTLRCNLHCTDCVFGCYNNNTWDCDPYATFQTIKKLVKNKTYKYIRYNYFNSFIRR